MLIEIVLVIAGGALAAVLVYYYFLAVASLWPEHEDTRPRVIGVCTTAFVIVIPAHNEERLIARTLRSVKALDYPCDRVRTVVVADNCTDRTADIARASGVESWVRDDTSRRGKGYALQWAFARLVVDRRADAYTVIDADTIVDSQFLRVLDALFSRGTDAVQGYHDVLRPERTPMASLTYVGYALSRTLKYPGRVRLGSSANLLGNGMAFSRRVIEQGGWTATSITEDGEYQLQLYLRGVKVAFARGARVASDIPATLRAYHAQQKRWNIGKYRLRRTYIPTLLRMGLWERDVGALHLAADLLLPSYTMIGGVIAAGWLAQQLLPTVSAGGRLLWSTVAAGFLVYTLAGLTIVRASPRVYANLLLAPIFLASRLVIAAAGLWGHEPAWTRSAR